MEETVKDIYIRQPIATFLSNFIPVRWHKPISIHLHEVSIALLKARRPQTEKTRQRIKWYEERLRRWE